MYDEESRMDDFLMKEARRNKNSVHLIRTLGLLGELCHDGTARELAEFLNQCDEKTDADYVRALIEAIGAIDCYSPEIEAAIERCTDAKYAPPIRNAARAALSRSTAKRKESSSEE
jgi:hypothetical protein